MKALVVEIKDKYAVVLKKDGTYTRIKNTGKLKIGYETEMPSGNVVMFPRLMRIASVAAAFFVIIGMGYGAYCYNSPYSYVSVDINPSVEITANRYDKILKVTPVNEDAQEVLEGISLKHKSLTEGLKDIVEAAIKEGYLKTEANNAMLITVASNDIAKADELETKVQKVAIDELNDSGINGEVLVEGTSRETQTEAEKIGITPGKLNLIRKLEAVKEDIKVEDYKDASVKQIMSEIKDAVKIAKNSGKGSVAKIDAEAAGTIEQATTIVTDKNGTSKSNTTKDNNAKDKTSTGNSGKNVDKKDNGKNLKAATTGADNEKELTSGITDNKNESTGTINDKQGKGKSKDSSWIEKKVKDILDSVGITQPDDRGNNGQGAGSKGNGTQKGNDKGNK